MTEPGSDVWDCFLHRLRLTCGLVYRAKLFHVVGELWQCYSCEGWGQGASFAELPKLSQQLISSVLCFFQDDNPQVYPTSPGPIPITLAVDHIVVKRRDDGVFYVTGQQHWETCFILLCILPILSTLGCAGGKVLCCAWCWRRLELNWNRRGK